jgi:hypothetical protein
MSSGEVWWEYSMKVSEDGKTVSVEVRISLESDGSIQMTLPGLAPPPIRIKNDAARPSGHPRLFRSLAKHLIENGVPAPLVRVDS